jgi:hypothetical protein
MKDLFRTIFSIRKDRRPLPVGRTPQVGDSIVRGHLKMVIEQPVSRELWDWLVLSGWRSVNVKHDRRRYTELPPTTLQTLALANPQKRNAVHEQILDSAHQHSKH